MDKWVIRTPRPVPGSEPSAPRSTAPASASRPHSSRHASSQPPTSRHASSQPPTSRASSAESFPPPRKKYKVEILVPRLITEPPQFEPLTLLPPHDTTAYILEKMLMESAGLAADGNPLPMNLGYLVGWTDLPAARMIIPAADVLDYVSPYMLEQFEYEDWKRRKQEEKEAHERLKRKLEAKKAAMESGQAAQVKKKPGRKRGRPRKKIEVPVDEGVIQEEVRKRAGSQVREGEPSLSTPSKKKGMGAGIGIGDAAPGDIYEQLYGDTAMESSETSYPVTSREESREVDSEPPRKRLRSSVSPTKEAGFGGGFVSGMSLTPHARPLRDSPQSLAKSDEPSPTHTGFTPIPPLKEARQTPQADTSSQSREASASPRRSTKPKKTRTPAKTPTPRSGTPKRQNGSGKKAHAAQEPDELVDVQYDVKRLEGVDEMVIDGKRERFFLVRWDGDWEENPTWEPEENIPEKLVRKYLTKNPPGSATKKKVEKPDPYRRRYSSVAEAFGVEETDTGNGVVEDGHDDNGDGEMFQVTEGTGAEGTGSQGTGTHGTGSQLLNRALGLAFGRGFRA